MRIIPAYAGSTSGSFATRGSARDHPRIRGEHCQRSSVAPPIWGSSPHTRGAPPARPSESILVRIIPAYAGSTWTRLRSGSGSGDHPRIRGEHPSPQESTPPPGGSSPHTRGALGRRAGLGRRRRIIPAYAGSTWVFFSRVRIVKDHPRIRGEHVGVSALWRIHAGSSPHTRGAPPRRYCLGALAGIIPAYAGST